MHIKKNEKKRFLKYEIQNIWKKIQKILNDEVDKDGWQLPFIWAHIMVTNKIKKK